MKILLVGEFSGLHNNLKDGLIHLGHEVTLASTGDGWKKYPSDINWISNKKGKIGYLEYLLNHLLLPYKLKGYDVIQFISSFTLFDNKFNIDQFLYKELIKRNGKSFLLVAGADPVFWRYWKNSDSKKINTFIRDTAQIDMSQKIAHRFDSLSEVEKVMKICSSVNGIIPIMYDYAEPYKQHKNICPTIGIPINCDKIHYTENIIKNDRLVIFHGLNRRGAKGTAYIERAFSTLKGKYPNDLELVIDGNMSYTKYKEFISRVNVVVDQTNFYSTGINGLISMASGKVLMGGSEPESSLELGYEYNPIINIRPDSNYIVSQIENLLERKKEISEIGQQSRVFVEKFHNHIDIAAKYVKQWRM